jgi:2-succinyl-6-hydroxy-2,4-cyclohexadiene-1-carboxylate synthase
MLAGTVEGAGPRLTLVHGFTQTGRSWGEVARLFASGFEVVRVDLPGHGRSAAADVGLSFEDTASAIGDVGGRGVYVGYSMGARLCLRLALDRPELVRALVLVGGSPGLTTDLERTSRLAADRRLADDIEAVGTAAFLRRWLGQRMFATLTPTDEDLEARRANPPEGLAAALRNLGVAAQEPLWGRLAELEMPVLLVAGELDAKFTIVAERMAAAIGANARAVTLPGCGHAAHLEQPDAFCRLVWTSLDPRARHGEGATEKRASSPGSGTTRPTGTLPSTGTSGSGTTSAAKSPALPRPQA